MAKKTKKNKLGKLYLPALQGEMGDWQYYTALMRFGDLAARVKFGGTVHKSKKLADMIQRFLKGQRAEQIATYLKEQKQRFFSSLVIGVYGGEPEWHSMQLKNAPTATISVGDIPVEVASSFGVLGLSGKEELFALDGQHRLAGIQFAQKEEWLDEDEEVSVVFVAHKNTKEGLARTRRLFTTLNKTAKPVSKPERIVLDQDDPAAVCTRHLVDEFFEDGAIRIKGGDSIPQQDRQSFTGITGLYDALRTFLPAKSGEDRRGFVHRVFDDEKLDDFRRLSEQLFEWIGDAMPDVKVFWEGSKAAMKASVRVHRRADGGHLLFRPVGLVQVIEAASLRWGSSLDAAKFDEVLNNLPMDFEEAPFADLIWDTEKDVVDVRGKSRARDLLRYMMGDKDEKTLKRLEDEDRAEVQALPRLAEGLAPKPTKPAGADDEDEDDDEDEVSDRPKKKPKP